MSQQWRGLCQYPCGSASAFWGTQCQITAWAAMARTAGLGVQPSSILVLVFPFSVATVGPWQLVPLGRSQSHWDREESPSEPGWGALEVIFLPSPHGLLCCIAADLLKRRMSIFCYPKIKAFQMRECSAWWLAVGNQLPGPALPHGPQSRPCPVTVHP